MVNHYAIFKIGQEKQNQYDNTVNRLRLTFSNIRKYMNETSFEYHNPRHKNKLT